MQCYTRSDDYFGEIERFIRVQREAGNINHARSKQATAQLDTICGKHASTWWKNDDNFVKTAAVVLRILMLKATKIHDAEYDRDHKNKLVTKDCIAYVWNTRPGLIHTDGVRDMPCPADCYDEAYCVVAYYDTQFDERKMKLHIREMHGNTGAFTETMAVVKKGERDIKFWFIITTWRIRKTPQLLHGRLRGFLYEVVPIVAVIYMEGNHQACNDWRKVQRQDFLQLEQLMENLNIDDNLRQAVRDNRPEAYQHQNAV